MKQFVLELLFQLMGVTATSGIIYNNQELHLISDESQYFYHYDIESKQLNKTPLTIDGLASEKMNKAAKPDYESITSDGVNFYIFGSGSKPNRNELIEVNRTTKEVISTQDLSILYSSMRSFAQLSEEDFNIEGVILDGNIWYFFNRGNGPKQANGIFVVEGESIIDDFRITYTPIKLPKINKVQSSFTDAIRVDHKIYFLATAEQSNSTYNDGEIKGSLIGRINLKNLKLEKTQIISNTNKFEGLSLYHKDNSTLEFVLCEDADNQEAPAGIYKLTLKR
ncbi:MAG: hypothetical protein LBE34_16605 [Flavobacteriaceae bacterium]|jgi:hypothetical protein|nr:hypothetical protein [Flavobacteriaceae bacterium]